ncbi:prepilin-type N-terminal cleavage/methylation domain-containing protein [Pelagirhabdus alkalitolerans]|uniref:Prepilin-type N-terminal cleavage/methylation domain-containing protein n=1 Tax=Pelagirhabdus alkalitolerans TaxID=1612202 RepID=A0A1G6HNR6_9BACI|nr:prepilin-type N-terminal cleavage/methylation domain-containing protein [Pelagirhabdus alkalitolerans]SDB95768.1 prepilin-type N-terminal cleavage/methylation domain-containing protein [Pelagirhabdus alkalitolerans]
MENQKGFTLVEVIISLAILSIVIIGFTSAFSHGYTLIGEGRNLTEETFIHQEEMEKRIVDTKNQFVEGDIESSDVEITAFQGSNYEAEVPVISLNENIRGNRSFQTFVSNVDFGKPDPPNVDLDVGIYSNSDRTKEVFPWIDDSIHLRADYHIFTNPPVFSNTSKWYQSNEDNPNPYFSSGFQIIDEITTEEPSGLYEHSLKSDDLNENYFYQFQTEAYTLAGRLGQFTHDDRIPILRRAGSEYWQDFIEDIYFDNVKIFRNGVYQDILLHADHPTLNVDWEDNVDPQGALIGIPIPDDYQNNSFKVSVDFSLDESALENDLEQHGIGISISDDNNSGLMLTMDVSNNTLRLDNTSNGNYAETVSEVNMLSDSRFSDFVDSEPNQEQIDWESITGATIIFSDQDVTININGERTDGTTLVSDSYEVDHNSISDPQYVGFKSYSSEDYLPDFSSEIVGKYDRNFSSSLFNATFEEVVPDLPDDWIDGGDNGFYAGNSSNITGSSRPLLDIEMNRSNSSLNGNRETIRANSFLFSPNMNLLTLGNNHYLNIEINDLVIFDIPIEFNDNAEGIDINGINDNSYPVYIVFRENGRDNLSSYSILGDYDVIKVDSMDVLRVNSGNILIVD